MSASRPPEPRGARMQALARAFGALPSLLLAGAGLAAAAEPPAAAPVTYNVYWGDLHGHTMDSPVTLTPATIDSYIRYGRDTQHLDFVALTEKDFDLSDSEWSDCKSKAAAYTSPSFVAFSAFEWGDAQFGSYGQRPVYFLTHHQPLL